MALNIPMPSMGFQAVGQGVAAVNPIMQRLLQQQQLEAQKKQHEQGLAFRKQQMAHAMRNDDLSRSIMQQQLVGLQHKNDPNYEYQQFQNLMNMANGDGQAMPQQGMAAQPQQPQEQGMQPPMEMPQGKGPLSPEAIDIGEQSPQQIPQQSPQQQAHGDMMEAMKANPMLRGFFKHKFGFDPLAGTDRPYQGAARNAVDLERLRKSEGEGSQVYQNAKAEYDANIQGKKDLDLMRNRTISGLKAGERWITDPNTNENIGIQHNLSEKERDREVGRTFFNELYPVVYKGASPFSGEGSIRRLEEVASKYNTDPVARKMFDDFLLAEKALTAATVNEAATIGAGKTNQTYKQLRQSLNASDIPTKIKSLIKQYQIPNTANLRASLRFQELINDAQNKANKMTPATRDLYFNPEQQIKENSKSEEEKAKDAQSGFGLMIDPSDNNAYRVPAADVPKRLAQGWKNA